jgi:hypothetical protein
VGDLDNSRVQEFRADGEFLSAFGSVGIGEGKFFDGPLGIAIDGSGNIFETEGTGTIQEFDPSGRFLRKWDQTGVDRLIALDHQGNIYVIGDKHHSLLKYRKP